MENLIIRDVYPSKAQYKKDDNIEIIVELNKLNLPGSIKCNVYRLNEKVYEQIEEKLASEELVFQFKPASKEGVLEGYGVEVEYYEEGKKLQTLGTAFDILTSWEYAPRYGFLSDFSLEEAQDENDLKEMNKYHINVVQYYDWMYRHHDLIPKTKVFIDPLNRELSLDTVKAKINSARRYGMVNLGYGAVYAAAPDYYKDNKELGLYKNNGEAFGFDNFLYIMDISKESQWHNHIINEFYKAVKFGFDGIHMDQYGFPKEAVNSLENLRNLREDFPMLINDTKSFIEDKGEKAALIFNAVNNWPVETVARAKEDAVYIEVWPPNDTYQDLYNLISNAKKYAQEKQVILAAYMKPFLKELKVPCEYAENATVLTMATIFASGGFHLLLGEKDGVLSDPYYPKYRIMENESFKRILRNYYDFIVRYEELLYDFNIIDTTRVNTGGINGEFTFDNIKASTKIEPDTVWTLVKEKPKYKIINMVNFTGIDNMNWNEGKEDKPREVKDIEIAVLTCNKVKKVYVASPDENNGAPVELAFKYVESDQGRKISFNIKSLKIWSLIYITW